MDGRSAEKTALADRDREQQVEPRTATGRRIDRHLPAELPAQRVDQREAEPSALPRGLRRKERLERPATRLVVHADAVIGDRQQHPAVGARPRWLGNARWFFDGAHRDLDAASVRQGVSRVDDQVHDGAFQCALRCPDDHSGLGPVERERDVFADQTLEQTLHSRQHLADVDICGLSSGLATERQQLLREFDGTPDRLPHLFDRFEVFVFQAAPEVVGIRADDE